MPLRLMKQILLFMLPALLILSACEPDPLKVDTEAVNLPEMSLLRMDQDFFKFKAEGFEEHKTALQKKYGILFEHFLMNPFRLNGSKDTACKTEILSFINDREIKGASKQIAALYSDLSDVQSDLSEMRKRFHFHFPKRPLPQKLMTCQSGWNYAVAYMDSSLILSLDMYLGDTSMYYQMLHYPKYQTRKMNRENIMPDLARGWLLTEFEKDKPENTLINHTIYYGKLFYCVEALLPDLADSLIIGYSAEQMKTCNKYQKQYWSYFAEKNRLYESSLQNIRELTSDGPFTSAIAPDCPPRIAMWIGWQIVRSYMKKNKVSIEELLNEKDAQKILAKSKYRP